MPLAEAGSELLQNSNLTMALVFGKFKSDLQ